MMIGADVFLTADVTALETSLSVARVIDHRRSYMAASDRMDLKDW